MIIRRAALCLAFFILLTAGCERTLSQKKTYNVSGKVLLDGQPVVLGQLELVPKTKGTPPAFGNIKADGTFELRTYGTLEADGAAAGEYTVVVTDYSANENPNRAAKGQVPTKFPAKFTSAETSGVTVEVKGDDELTIELK